MDLFSITCISMKTKNQHTHKSLLMWIEKSFNFNYYILVFTAVIREQQFGLCHVGQSRLLMICWNKIIFITSFFRSWKMYTLSAIEYCMHRNLSKIIIKNYHENAHVTRAYTRIKVKYTYSNKDKGNVESTKMFHGSRKYYWK